MNIRNILAGGIALVSMVTVAKADVTSYYTGSTAFRTTVITAIKNQYLAEPIATRTFAYVHNAAANQATNATVITFAGKYPGVTGTTTINLTWGGSLSGLKAVSTGSNVGFMDTTAVGQVMPAGTATGAELALASSGTVTPTTVNHAAEFAFSDVLKTAAPAANVANISGPASPKVGVLIFAPLVNSSVTGITNCTTQQLKALLTGGRQKKRLWTGVSTDVDNIYAVGRDDGSGTRAFYLAETGLGFTKTVNQYCAIAPYGGSGEILKIGLTPQGVTSGNFKASTLWGQDANGNGGYASGDVQNVDFGRSTASCEVVDAAGSNVEGPGASIGLMCMLGGADVKVAVTNGAKALSWNGVGIDFSLSTISAGDAAKVYQGQYSAWSFENLYYKTAPVTDALTVYNGLKTQINTVLLALSSFDGVSSSTTVLKASRSVDGSAPTN